MVNNTKSLANTVTSYALTKTWVRTANFRSIRTTGGNLPDNAFSYSETKLFPTWGTSKDYYSRVHTLGPYVAATAGSTAVDFNSTRMNSLNSKLIQRAKGQQWNAPVFFAEAEKTAKMVYERASQLAHMAHDLRRGNIVGFFKRFHSSVIPPGRTAVKRFNDSYGRNAGQAVSNAWLEYSYGWVPFMSDVRSMVNTLMDSMDRPEKMTSRVKATEHQSGKSVAVNQYVFSYGYPTGVNVYCDVAKSWTEDYRAIWKFRVRAADLPARFGLVNPLEVIWELVPFSFVADWFYPIGDYLSSLDVGARFEHVGGSYGGRTYTETQNVNPRAPSSGFGGVSKNWEIKRQPMTSAPALSFFSMQTKGILESVPKMLTSISLLNQQVSRFQPIERLAQPTSTSRKKKDFVWRDPLRML